MPIVWNDKARAQIPPRTREAAGPFKPQKPETIWAAVHKTFGKRGNYDPIEGTFVKGRSLATPEMAAAAPWMPSLPLVFLLGGLLVIAVLLGYELWVYYRALKG